MSGISGHVVVGTPAYLSPEAHAHQRAHPSFDLWALSVVFYEILTGRRPFEGGTPEELAAAVLEYRAIPLTNWLPVISPGLSTFFEAAFSSELSRRPRSAAQLTQRLLALR